jgi:hypothetical protein
MHEHIPTPLQIYKQICTIRSKNLENLLQSRVESERTRLNADPLTVIRKRIEAELIMASHLDYYYGKVIELETDVSAINYNVLLLELLIKKITFVKDKKVIFEFMVGDFERYFETL